MVAVGPGGRLAGPDPAEGFARLEAEIHNDDDNVVLKKVRQRRRSPSLDFETVQALLIMLLEERKKIDKLQNSATQVKYICWTMGWTKGG